MAPERLNADKVDPRADTYALTCVFHECLTGTQPFPGHSLERHIVGHLNVPPPRPPALRIGLPAQLDAVIATGMAKNPDHRFSTVTEMARAARAAITQATTPTHGHGAEPVRTDHLAFPPTAPRNYYPAAPGGGAVHTDETQYQYVPHPSAGGPRVPSGPTGGPIPPATGSNGPGGTPSQPKRKRNRIILVSGTIALITVAAVVGVLAFTGGNSGSPGSPGGGTGPQSSAGPFTGTYTVAFGPSIDLSGKEEQGMEPPGNETWTLRSECGAKGCVATASRSSGKFPHPTSMVFDDINGRWNAVALDTEKCHGHDLEEWHWIYLRPRPDGTMTGEWIEDSIDCYSKRSVTFTRTCDANIAGVTDPASLPARVASPALGLRGFYRSRVTGGGQTKPGDQDFSVDTFRLRAGDRCLSRFVLTDFTDHQLFMFASGGTRNTDYDIPCAAAGQATSR